MGLSQDEFGKLVGVSPGTIGNWESGERRPRNKAGKLKELGVDIRAIEARPATPTSSPGAREGLLLMGIRLAITALRDGRDPQEIADFLDTLSHDRNAQSSPSLLRAQGD